MPRLRRPSVPPCQGIALLCGQCCCLRLAALRAARCGCRLVAALRLAAAACAPRSARLFFRQVRDVLELKVAVGMMGGVVGEWSGGRQQLLGRASRSSVLAAKSRSHLRVGPRASPQSRAHYLMAVSTLWSSAHSVWMSARSEGPSTGGSDGSYLACLLAGGEGRGSEVVRRPGAIGQQVQTGPGHDACSLRLPNNP